MKRILFLIAFFVLSTSTILAQTNDGSLNMVVSPLPINLITTPNSSISAQLKIKNGGVVSENLKVELMKFSAFGEEGKPKLLDREKGDDYFDWVKFSESNFTVGPGEWKTITMDINVPDRAAFGYYYAVTFSRDDQKFSNDPSATKFNGATATLVLLEVRVPNAIRNVEVLEFSTNRRVYEYLPAGFTLKLKNSGNVHVAPRGNIFISNKTNDNVGRIEVNDIKGNVLPGSNRIFDSQWIDGFPVYEQEVDNTGKKIITNKKGNVIRKLKWDLSKIQKFRIGKYTASMTLVYDDGVRDVPIEAKLDFWVIPWKMILLTIVVIFANIFFVGWIVWFIRNGTKNRRRYRR